MQIFSRRLKLEVITILFLYLLVAVGNVAQPVISSRLLDYATVGNISKVGINVVYMLLVTIAILVFELIHKMLEADYIKKVTDLLREKLLKGIITKSYKEFNSNNSQKYISLFNNEIPDIVEDYYNNFIWIMFCLFSIIVYSFALFTVNWILAIVILVTNIFPMIVPKLFSGQLDKKKSKAFDLLQKYNIKVGDAINGYELAKLNSLRNKILTLTNIAGRKATKANKEYEQTSAYCEIGIGIFSYVSSLSIIIVGVYLIYKGNLTAGGLLAAVSISELLVTPVNSISSSLNTFYGIKGVKEELFKTYFKENEFEQNNREEIELIQQLKT